MAFQPSHTPNTGIKRKLSNNDEDDVDLLQDDINNVMNPSKRHTQSQRVQDTDIPFEDQAPDDDSSDSQYEYTFYDDDQDNKPFIPISENIIKTKHNKTPNDDDEDIDINQFINNDNNDDDDDDLMMDTSQNASFTVPDRIKDTALELNWSDEDECIEQYESDAPKQDNNNNGDDDSKTNDNDTDGPIAWFPTQKEDMERTDGMEYNKSAYNVLFQFNTEWPCLSFDIIRDNLGAVRTSIPYSMYLVTGSQADPSYRNDKKSSIYKNKDKENKRISNKIQFLKLNEIQKTKYDDDTDDMNEEKDIEYNNITDDEPILQNRDIHHPSIVNRIRTKCINNQHLVATQSADCNMYIYNGTQHILSLDGLSTNLESVTESVKPIFCALHCDEGYGLSWNRIANEPLLLTGSCAGELRLYQSKSSKFERIIQFKTLKASIEDIEWSPMHKDIFVSVGVDKCIRIWDIRNHKKEHVARIQNAHKYDINVCSWNPHNDHQHLLLTGSDDNSFKIWDLRKLYGGNNKFNKKLKKCGHYYLSSWHIGGITSIEWHPNDSSSAMVASEDNQISIWDFSLEQDNTLKNTGAKLENNNNVKIPPQLTFIHGGQQDIKEVHFHPQIPNMCISTAGSGFHIFQPDNLMQSFREQFKNMTIID